MNVFFVSLAVLMPIFISIEMAILFAIHNLWVMFCVQICFICSIIYLCLTIRILLKEINDKNNILNNSNNSSNEENIINENDVTYHVLHRV